LQKKFINMKKLHFSMIAIVGIFSLFSCVKDCPPTDPTPTPGLKDTMVTYQPDSTKGQDAFVSIRSICTNYTTTNFGNRPLMPIAAWTFNAIGCGVGGERSLIKFVEMNAIPANATIVSAKLSLFGVSSSGEYSSGNSTYPNSPYNSSGFNDCWIQRATSTWDENTVTWSTQPTVSLTNQVSLAPSTLQWNYNAVDMDVTNLVKDMRATGNTNNGFLITLKDEQYYRSIIFATSENTNAALRPKLVISYKF
jgi:hypothetical protein